MIYPKVSIVIVNYSQKEITLNCLESLNKITYPNFEVIVVDNNSQDDSVKAIVNKYKSKIKLIRNQENLGFVGGNNIGIKSAVGDYILLLNNDTIVTPGFLQPLVEDFQTMKNLGMVQSKMFVMDHKELLDNVVTYQTSTGFLFHKGYLDRDKPEYRKFMFSFSVKGACVLIDKKVLTNGLFDERYFAYFEETDLCWRLWLMGFTVGFEPRSIIYHKMGVTSSKINKNIIQYHSFKNRLRTILKNASLSTLIWMLPPHVFLCLTLIGYFAFIREGGVSKSIIKALWWNLVNSPDTLIKRKVVQKMRKVSDEEIFKVTLKNPSLSSYLNHLSLLSKHLSYDREAR